MSTKFNLVTILLLLSIITGCHSKSSRKGKMIKTKTNEIRYQPKEYVELEHPGWSKNASIYEVNIRQFTPEGTFKAFESHLPRLKALGIDIIWLMPIHPIGMKNRKGSLGSYYSVQDYYGVNPKFGTMKDFKNLVNKIHKMGMHVVIDWVANHSAWDNPLVTEHPEWYIKTREGNFEPTPWRDYDDIIDFDYSKPGIRKYMTEALKFWVKETNIDGFRCDMASFVPIEFWENAREELDAIKPVFMLAEAADRDLHKRAFDMTFSWSLWDHLYAIVNEDNGIDALTGGYIAEHVSIWPSNGYRMNFIDNHDKNSWEGTQFSNFKDGLEAAIVLTCTIEGMPMMYSGQEAGLNRSLNFFEKDPIQWRKHKIGAIYSKLLNLKHINQALWNGKWGGRMERIKNDQMNRVISFSRQKNDDKVVTIVNLNKAKIDVNLESRYHKGSYRDLFSEKEYILKGNDNLKLNAWSYLVLVQE